MLFRSEIEGQQVQLANGESLAIVKMAKNIERWDSAGGEAIRS